MSYQTIRSLLETRLNDLMPPVRTVWENVKFTPINGEIYQRAFILPSSTDNPTYGDSMHRESGIFQISVCTQLGIGSNEAMSRAEFLRSWFPRGLTLKDGDVSVIIPRTPSIASAITEEINYVIPVSVPYFSDM